MRVRRLVATSTVAGLLGVGGLAAVATSTLADPASAPSSSETPAIGSIFGPDGVPTVQFVTNEAPPASAVETEPTATSTPTTPSTTPPEIGSLAPIEISTTPSTTDPAPAADPLDPASLLARVASLLQAIAAGS